MGTLNSKKLMRNKDKLTKILAEADEHLKLATEAFVEADMTEHEFKDACAVVARLTVIKAAISSLPVMREG